MDINDNITTGDDDTPEAEQLVPAAPDITERIKKEALEWAKSIVTAVVIALVLRATVVQSNVIPTGSMSPTIEPKDRVFTNRFIYRFRQPERGEIIVFRPTEMAMQMCGTKEPLLKRVVGLPGDTIGVHNGNVYINGAVYDEPYLPSPLHYEMQDIKIPDKMIFAMGDNRNNSCDSHYWGPLPIKNIQGKAFVRFWPPNRVGALR